MSYLNYHLGVPRITWSGSPLQVLALMTALRAFRFDPSRKKQQLNMGFLSGLFGAVVKVAITPVAVVKDVVNVAVGEKPDATKKLLEQAKDDTAQALDDLAEGDL